MSKLSETELVWQFEGSDGFTVKVCYTDKIGSEAQIELATYYEGKRDKYMLFDRKDMVHLLEILEKILNTDKLK